MHSAPRPPDGPSGRIGSVRRHQLALLRLSRGSAGFREQLGVELGDEEATRIVDQLVKILDTSVMACGRVALHARTALESDYVRQAFARELEAWELRTEGRFSADQMLASLM